MASETAPPPATAPRRFAAALDRWQPLLSNVHTQGGAWQEHGVGFSRVVARHSEIARGSSALWDHVRTLPDEALAKGDLPPDEPQTGSESTS